MYALMVELNSGEVLKADVDTLPATGNGVNSAGLWLNDPDQEDTRTFIPWTSVKTLVSVKKSTLKPVMRGVTS